MERDVSRVSVTDLGSFPACRRYWLWSKTWAPTTPNENYWMGTAVHVALEGYYLADRKVEPGIEALEEWADKSFKSMAKHLEPWYWKEIAPEYEEKVGLAAAMLDNYAQYDAENTLLHGEILEVETFYSANTKSYLKGKGLHLVGKVDLVIRNSQGIWLVDHKTSSRTPTNEVIDVDGQLTAYAYLYWRKHRVKPSGVYFNFLFKGAPEPPKLIRKGTALSKAKDQYSTPPLYREAIQEYGFNPEDYEEIIEHLEEAGWANFFHRVAGVRNVKEMIAFERRLRATGSDIIRAKNAPKMWAYPSPNIYNCQGCIFSVPCKAADDGGDAEAILRNLYTTESLY